MDVGKPKDSEVVERDVSCVIGGVAVDGGRGDGDTPAVYGAFGDGDTSPGDGGAASNEANISPQPSSSDDPANSLPSRSSAPSPDSSAPSSWSKLMSEARESTDVAGSGGDGAFC